jgi:hypothetical protein
MGTYLFSQNMPEDGLLQQDIQKVELINLISSLLIRANIQELKILYRLTKKIVN